MLIMWLNFLKVRILSSYFYSSWIKIERLFLCHKSINSFFKITVYIFSRPFQFLLYSHLRCFLLFLYIFLALPSFVNFFPSSHPLCLTCYFSVPIVLVLIIFFDVIFNDFSSFFVPSSFPSSFSFFAQVSASWTSSVRNSPFHSSCPSFCPSRLFSRCFLLYLSCPRSILLTHLSPVPFLIFTCYH